MTPTAAARIIESEDDKAAWHQISEGTIAGKRIAEEFKRRLLSKKEETGQR